MTGHPWALLLLRLSLNEDSMTRHILFALLLITLSSAQALSNDLRVVDDANRTVELQSHASRVAVVAPFGADLMERLGIEPGQPRR